MKVKDFKGFMSSKAINEQENFDGTDAGMQYGANPEDEAAEGEFEEGEELEDGEMEGEEEEVTLEDLKAMVDDLTERIEALEPDEELEDEDAEGEEGLEDEEGAEEEAI